MNIQELRNSGYKVKVLHHRLYNGEYCYGSYYRTRLPDCKGGFTKVIIDSPSGEHFEGEAKCSDKDNYNKKLGVRIALGRCGLNFNSEQHDKVSNHSIR